MGLSQELEIYRQMAVEIASPIEVVIMLCDLLVKDLNKVIAAIRIRDVEERVKHSNHAFDVLQELELMLDFENGGNTAKELSRVYSYVRAKLMESQFKLGPAVLERQIEFIQQIREFWQKAVATVAKESAAVIPATKMPPLPQGAFPPYAMGEEVQSCSWSA
jgi:flagellar biosynthetic protein FliS